MLLLVRSADDLGASIEAAGAFLVHLRRRSVKPREFDEVLGLWLRRELDADLPTWIWPAPESRAGVRVGDDPVDASGPGPRETAVGIREAFSLLGLWSLCWIDGTLLREAKNPGERRLRLLESLATDAAPRASRPGAFFPVFEATEPSGSIEPIMRELGDRFPHLVGGRWFVDDRELGLLVSKSAHR